MYVLYYIVLFYIATIKLCLCALKCFKDHQKTLGIVAVMATCRTRKRPVIFVSLCWKCVYFIDEYIYIWSNEFWEYPVKFRDLLHSSIIFLDCKVIVHYFSRILRSYLGIKNLYTPFGGDVSFRVISISARRSLMTRWIVRMFLKSKLGGKMQIFQNVKSI